MIDSTHIDGEKMRKPLTKKKPDDPEQVIQWYVDNYDQVEKVTCGKCKTPMCLWVLDPAKVGQMHQVHHQGHSRITLSGKLMATRKRLDGHMGYWCLCGNDSRLADVERGIIPQQDYDADGNLLNPEQDMDIHPHHEAAVRILLAQKGYDTKVTQSSGKITVDGFIHERLR